MRNNPNKAVSAKPYGVIISYTDSRKHHNLYYEPSILTNKQLYNAEQIQSLKDQYYNSKKFTLLSQALYGYRTYTKAELNEMSQEQLDSIKLFYNKAQKVINRLKNEKMQVKLNSFLTKIFFKSTLAKQIANFNAHEELYYKNNMSFHELGISMDQVVSRLIKANVLPRNYHSL